METLIKAAGNSMQKIIDFLSGEYKSLRAGRANPLILNKISVKYYGNLVPIEQTASISVPEPHTLIVQPWDASSLSEIEKAIQKSNLGVIPQNDGKVVRLIFPPLSEDRRHEISKRISILAEEAKVSIRSVRHNVIEKVKKTKKDGKASEDDARKTEKKIQKLTDESIKKIDCLKEFKIKQIMEV
jgi:ribosome recycling factor